MKQGSVQKQIGKVIWGVSLATSGPVESRLGSVEAGLCTEVEALTRHSSGSKAVLSFFYFTAKHNSVSNKGRPVNLCWSQLNTFLLTVL